jgi:hypothetical protein
MVSDALSLLRLDGGRRAECSARSIRRMRNGISLAVR